MFRITSLKENICINVLLFAYVKDKLQFIEEIEILYKSSIRSGKSNCIKLNDEKSKNTTAKRTELLCGS